MNVGGSGWRRAAYLGARFGPRPWVRYSPAFFGAIFACLLPVQRSSVRRNLRLLRGRRPSVVEGVDVLRTFVAYAHCLAESLAAERPEAVGAEPVVVGREHLDEALRAGKGVVVVTAHTGSWDAAARFLRRDRAIEVLLVMAAEDDAAARGLHDSVRERGGLRVVHVGAEPLAALPLLRHLRGGGVVAVQLDRTRGSQRSLEVELCGQPFRVPEGPFRLAALSGAAVLPVFARRAGYFRYEVVVSPPITVPPKAGHEQLAQAARAAAGEMAHFLRGNPTQWFHFSG